MLSKMLDFMYKVIDLYDKVGYDQYVFLNHPTEQQIVHILIEDEIMTSAKQEARGIINPEDDSTEVLKISCQ